MSNSDDASVSLPWIWSGRALRLLNAFPRLDYDDDQIPFVSPNALAAQFAEDGRPVSEAVISFQRKLAGHVFYTGRHHGRQYRWGIQFDAPDNGLKEPYEFECVALTDALPVVFLLRTDGQIFANDDYYARDARVLVESQAVDFEWHTTVALHVPIYRIHLPIQPRSNPFWTAVVNAARNLCLEKLEAASDELRQYFVRPDAYLSTEPYFGVRSFAEDIPAAMGMFTCTSEQDAQAFYDALAVSAGWPPLIWKPLPEQRNSQGAYPQGFSFMPKWVS